MEQQKDDSGLRSDLWNSLWQLRHEIDRLAADGFDGSERQKKLITLLARIVVAELDHRGRKPSPEENGHDKNAAK